MDILNSTPNLKKIKDKGRLQQQHKYKNYKTQLYQKIKNLKQEKVKSISQKYYDEKKKFIQDNKKLQDLKIKQQIQIIQELYNKDYQIALNKISSDKDVIFVGNTSAGKSKPLNKLFSLNLQTGNAETTLEFKGVYTIVFILFHWYIESIEEIDSNNLQVKIENVQSVFVYTMFDNVDINEKPIKFCIEQERQYLKLLGIENTYEYPFFMGSGKFKVFGAGENENYKILNMINQLRYA